MANKSISQLDSASTLQGTDLIEIASDQGSSTYASKSTTLSGLESFLNGNLIEDVSNKFTLNSSLELVNSNFKAIRIANIVFVAFEGSITHGSPLNTTYKLYDIDSSIRPIINLCSYCRGWNDSSRLTVDSFITVRTTGELETNGGEWNRFSTSWIINN